MHHDLLLILEDLRQGKMIILTDNKDREDEGDLVCAAEMISTDVINFMIRQGSGIVCLALAPEIIAKLGLSMMVTTTSNPYAAPFTVTIEAARGVTTGVSASDRVKTILTAVNETAVPADLVSPGHVFPLQAKSGGVLEREGHTEGSVDLARLADLKSAAVICELMNADGTMMKGEQLHQFAEYHQIRRIAIADVIQHRLMHENLIAEQSESEIPLDNFGKFHIAIAREKYTHHEQIILSKNIITASKPLLTRIHSSCATGDLFGSLRCDCKEQLNYSLQRISIEGGILIYLSQEGRGIGLFDKIKSYTLQDHGLDTVEANQALNYPADLRKYHIAACILKNRGISQIRLLTNNPHKLQQMTEYGISCQHEPMEIFSNEFNLHYLRTKVNKLNHSMNLI
jgi:3,4-dihydroxy 2-butanone 4-phosphate synthase/GTP cyclohydrolase II